MKVIQGKEGEIFDIELSEDLLNKNKELAEENKKILEKHSILAIDVMGSIGSGKTTLIKGLVNLLKDKYQVAVFAGDLTTTIDADSVEEEGAQVIQVNTGMECHLDANLVQKALKEIDLEATDILIIENVGNLICPADFPLGSHKRIVLISLTEGPFTVVKHPFIFIDADIGIINKIDLKDAMGVDPEPLKQAMFKIKPNIKVVETNSRTGEGIKEIINCLGLST